VRWSHTQRPRWHHCFHGRRFMVWCSDLWFPLGQVRS